MEFNKIDDVVRNVEIFVEELEQEQNLVKVKYSDIKLYNPYEVKEDAQVTDEDEETKNDYMLEREISRRVIKPPKRLGYVDLVAFALISASKVLDEEPRDYKEALRSRNKTE